MDDPLDDELLGETIQRSPKYAINYDRPFYRVLREKDGAELREYEPTTWVVASDLNRRRHWFNDLFQYMNCHNDQRQKIPMTVPAVAMRPFSGFLVGSERSMMFFVRDRQPPKPTEKTLQIEQWPSAKLWVKKFGGYTLTGRVQGNARELMNIIGDEYHDVDMQRAFVAAFDAPLHFWSQHNEIAFRVNEPQLATRQRSCKRIA